METIMAIAPQRTSIGLRRHFTTEGVHPYDDIVWDERDSRITDYRDGSVAFEQRGVEVPAGWSLNATNILAQKYFRGTPGTAEREWSLRQVADRVADTITDWGLKDGYFEDASEAEAFRDELKYLIVHQRAAFNSPVWFNIGVGGVPQQASACFILSVDDSMDSILNWYREEGVIFKGGSGAGVNLSSIRASVERLQGGGTASGPVSFMRGADASAGTIKSGGKTRRAAKMVILNDDHPDVEDFIWCKAIEERKARVLRDAGFDMDLDGSDSFSIQYQNANNSVRVTDEFMQAVVDNADWALTARTDGSAVRIVKARDLFRQIAHAAWECADPGMQFDTTINRWHTAPNAGRINGSNPCSEYMHLDNSACNLASINLLKYLRDDGSFDAVAFNATVDVMFTAQEILVGNADYPTEKIAENSRRYRELGLGYANLGALLMAQGLPYDSDEGRAWAAAITALMTGQAYATSARTAARMGPFAGYHADRDAMLDVLRMHRAEVAKIDEELVPTELLSAAQEAWDDAVELGEQFGVRNAQASVLAPTGTIALMMDCDTTGVEPDLGLVKTKKLVGGGTMSIVNQTIPRALARMGYSPEQVEDIVAYIDQHKSIVGAPHLSPEHLPVFACSMGDNTIHHLGHVRMMAAVQPFISGAISKCVVGETLLATSDGLIRIGSLHRGEEPDSFRDEILAVASVGGMHKTDAFYYGGLRPVRRAVLRSGLSVTGTPNHRLLTAGPSGLDWKRLDELEPGDYVATKYGDDLWADVAPRFDDFTPSVPDGSEEKARVPAHMTEALAFFLGAYASEGHTSRRTWTVTITNAEANVLEDVVEAARICFGITPEVRNPADRCASVEITSRTVVEFLDHLGCGARPSAKRIPDAVLRSPRELVLSFLRGLWLEASATSDAAATWAISLDAPLLLDDLQAVLTNLGIVTGRVTRHDAVDDKDVDEVYATGVDAQRLVGLVPFLERHKDAAARTMAQGRLRETDTAGVVPGLSPAELATVIEDNLRFSPVTSVEDAGEREVFDVSVPDTHAFVGNGIVNHNTVNLPEEVSVEDIEQLHLDAWRMGIKAIAIYRDNCKVAQPLSTTKKEGTVAPDGGDTAPPGSEAEARDREIAAKIADLEAALAHERSRTPEPLVVGAVRE
ncbi:MAG TPA: vitamin B12-dependent ribonucleotide reductase, partial [Acidimicrobiales bacterium]|nr:vitamin B12-dependent ribonucleotide reductase [Acidimicrobiales bacterium]